MQHLKRTDFAAAQTRPVAPASPPAPIRGRARGAAIRVEQLAYRYRGASGACLTGIDFKVAPGEITALIGRSGCGKSTLLHLIAGLLQPDTGAVYIDGDRVRQPSPRWVMMFQSPSLFPWMTVTQNAGIGLRFAGRAHEIPERVPALLQLVELTALAHRNVQDLSGGQQQRVALARSLATEPELLLLDEPFSALDTFTRTSLQRDLRRIARDLGLSVVLVTHDIAEAVMIADRAIVMTPEPGRLVADIRLQLGETRSRECPDFDTECARLADIYATRAGH